jgi:hypothetical protein
MEKWCGLARFEGYPFNLEPPRLWRVPKPLVAYAVSFVDVRGSAAAHIFHIQAETDSTLPSGRSAGMESRN